MFAALTIGLNVFQAVHFDFLAMAAAVDGGLGVTHVASVVAVTMVCGRCGVISNWQCNAVVRQQGTSGSSDARVFGARCSNRMTLLLGRMIVVTTLAVKADCLLCTDSSERQ